MYTTLLWFKFCTRFPLLGGELHRTGKSAVRKLRRAGSYAVRKVPPYGKHRRAGSSAVQKTLACGRLCRAETFAVRKAPPQGNVRSEGNSAVRELRFARTRGPAARNLPRAGASACRKFRHTESSAARTFPPYGKLRRTENPAVHKIQAVPKDPPCGALRRKTMSVLRKAQPLGKFRRADFPVSCFEFRYSSSELKTWSSLGVLVSVSSFEFRVSSF